MSILSAIIETSIILIAHAACSLHASSLKYKKWNVVAIWIAWIIFQTGILLYLGLVFGLDPARPPSIGFFTTIIGQYLIYFLTTKGRFSQRLFTILTYSLFYCIFASIFSLIKSAYPEMNIVFKTIIEVILIYGVAAYFILYVCPLYKAASTKITKGWHWNVFVNIIFMTTIIISSAFPVKLTANSIPAVISFLLLCIAIMAVYPVIFLSIKVAGDAETKKEVERQNQLLLAQMEMENMQIMAARQLKHDRRHHILVMLEYANNNNVEAIRNYLQSLADSEAEAEIVSPKRFCENRTLNTALGIYEQKALKKNIKVNFICNASDDLAVQPKHLIIIIANLFENAINATSKLVIRDKYINISIKEKTKRLIIEVTNTCKTNTIFDETYYGIGINSVISTTQQYSGMYDFSVDRGIFKARICLNLE